MAFIRQHPKSQFYYAVFHDEQGKRHDRSTKSIDRKLALKIAIQFEEAYSRRQTETQIHHVFSDICEQINGTRLTKATLEEFQDIFMEQKSITLSSDSVRDYTGALKHFVEHVGKDKLVHHVTPAIISRYRDEYAKRVAATTVNSRLRILTVFFSTAYKLGYVSENPMKRVERVTRKRDKASGEKHVGKRGFTLGEIQRILEHCDDEWRGMVLLASTSGQRLKDISLLVEGEINLFSHTWSMSTSKTGRDMSIPLLRPFIEWYKPRATGDSSKPVFPRAHDVYQRTGRGGTLSNRFYEIMANAGIVEPRESHAATKAGRQTKRDSSEISFHSFRHGFTTLLKESGASEAVAMSLVGHDSKQVSQNYTHISDEARGEALERLQERLVL